MADHGWYILCPIFKWEDNVDKFMEKLSEDFGVQDWQHDSAYRVLMIEIRRPPAPETIRKIADKHFNKMNSSPIHVLFTMDGLEIEHNTNKEQTKC